MELDNVEAFAVGTWNGKTFSEADLDEMVTAFDALGLAGKLPVKLGHTTKDSEPAQGWISALRREGGKLLAKLTQVPKDLIDEIKEGRWRHVSIELLRDVKANGKTYRWVPDALAILGAARPAVESLAGLHTLVASALPGFTWRERLAFSRDTDDSAQLREQVATLTSQLVAQTFNSAIRDGRLAPAERERFERRYGKNPSLEDAQAWIADAPRPPAGQNRPTGFESANRDSVHVGGRADEQLVAAAVHLQNQAAERGQELSYEAAARIVMQRDPELAQRWVTFPDEHYT
jgi:hypothetical protein